MEKLGKCPKCGADYLEGQYGPYCTGKCGFRIGKTAFGHELTTKEKKDLLAKKKVLLKGLVSKKSGNTYDMYIQPTGIREFSYVSRQGNTVTGYEYEYKTEFPNTFEKKPESKSPDIDYVPKTEEEDGSDMPF